MSDDRYRFKLGNFESKDLLVSIYRHLHGWHFFIDPISGPLYTSIIFSLIIFAFVIVYLLTLKEIPIRNPYS